ncbi:MAG: acylneuraminate cytidylyltransferase family protein, partial [Pseudomonadota bacterium]
MADGDVAIVPVRAGSKGLAGKNLKPFAGEPLYLRAVRQGLRVAPRCIVTTDSQDILASTPPQGCTLHPRPAQLAVDSTPMAPVLSDVIAACGLAASRVVLLQPTSPLRLDADVEDALRLHAA